MGSLKLQSFEDFAHGAAKLANAKLEEEQSAARTAAADQFKHLLGEFGVTSIKELSDANRHTFYQKLGASEISESTAIIEEGTRSQIGKIKKNGKITTVYMHYDGYPDHMLPTIKKGYRDGKAVDLLLKKGGGSGLDADPSNIKFYGDKTTIDGNMKDTESFVKDAANDGGAEFIYLYSERDSKWYMVDVYDSYDLVPAFESTIINEGSFKPSKGNLRDAKKVNKSLEQFFMKHVALTENSELLLGVCKYMIAEALTDANFHRYRDPVSKVIKGRITTVMVEIERLGGINVPVGKKSIINLLDDTGAFMASAASWSGIGIVEGMALFLDGFGHSDTAQKIVDAFELIYANESLVNEASLSGIEFGNDDGIHPTKHIPLTKSLKKHKVKMEVEKEEGDHGYPEVKLTGKRKDIEKVLADIWGPDSIDDHEDAYESVITEAEIKSDEEFKEYAFAVLGKAFGDDFDEEKAQEVVDGLLSKHGEEYGAAVGALTSSLG